MPRQPTPPAFCLVDIHPERRHDVLDEQPLYAEPALPFRAGYDGFGNIMQRACFPPGKHTCVSGVVRDSGELDSRVMAPAMSPLDLPDPHYGATGGGSPPKRPKRRKPPCRLIGNASHRSDVIVGTVEVVRARTAKTKVGTLLSPRLLPFPAETGAKQSPVSCGSTAPFN